MRKLASFAVMFLLCGGMMFPQTEEEYHEWMQSVRSSVGSLRKSIEAKDQSATSQHAKELQEIFAKVRGFWEAKKVPDAVKFSTASEGSFEAVAKAASENNFESASAEMKQAMANCAGCHNAHREKTESGFKIKY